jgi:hypothetical protein
VGANALKLEEKYQLNLTKKKKIKRFRKPMN